MTSWHSMLACAQADVTIERIISLAATTGTEPLTVDFKEKATSRLADCVASMANAQRRPDPGWASPTPTARSSASGLTRWPTSRTCWPPGWIPLTGCRKCSRSLSATTSQASMSW